jgi:hypothetical protein
VNERVEEVMDILDSMGIHYFRLPSGIEGSPYDHVYVYLTDDAPQDKEEYQEWLEPSGPVIVVTDGVEVDYAPAPLYVSWSASDRENETLTPCDVLVHAETAEDAAHLVLRLTE